MKPVRADEYDDAPDSPGMMGGSISDLTPEAEDEDTGLVDVAGNPIRREPPPRRLMGFHVRECE